MGWIDEQVAKRKALEITVQPGSTARQRLVLWLCGEGMMPSKGQNVIADVVHHALNAAVMGMEAYEAWEKIGPVAGEKVNEALVGLQSEEGQAQVRRVGAAVMELLSYPRVLMVTRTSKRFIVNRVHDGEVLVDALEKAARALREKRGRGVRGI